jgi:excisionase family DNA binding protein
MKLATRDDGELRKFFSVVQIAEALGVHPRTIVRKIQRKEITAVRWEKNIVRVPEDELERIMQQQREGREWT